MTIIIDNFLPYPNIVREWALQKQFYDSNEYSNIIGLNTRWPGKRTLHVMDLDIDYSNVMLNAISTIIKNNYYVTDLSIKSYFQICTKNDGDSWVHRDDSKIAGLLYLTPNAPISSGTTLYSCNDIHKYESIKFDEILKINRYERNDLYNNLFNPIDIIGNIYNRLVLYDGNIFHKSNDYFGDNNTNGRLTQVFFVDY